MTLQQLHYTITISECGSMNKAAEILYIAQPSLTSAVKELEKELGITIFHRSGKGVTLTADGAEFPGSGAISNDFLTSRMKSQPQTRKETPNTTQEKKGKKKQEQNSLELETLA